MKILFISYYFEPFPGVGAKRISYWANNCAKHGIEATVITATEQPNNKTNIKFVAQKKSTSLLRFFIKDQGLDWKEPLINYFENEPNFAYDFVLISGGPFMHFSISNYLTKKFNTKVILDFRDPYSNNPSFKDGFIKKGIKSFFEKKFIKNATALIAVNKYCANLIVSNSKKTAIIDNGFDESVFIANQTTAKNSIPIIAHAGTFIEGLRSPEIFLEVMRTDFNHKMQFNQYGKDSNYFDAFRKEDFFNYKGMMPYSDLIKELKNADICLLITEGRSFESTTKVFDYIGLNKKILILTNGEPKTGNLHELTKDYPNIVWAKNNKKDINEGLSKMIKMNTLPFDAYAYSRAFSLEKLVDLLKSLS